jgi:D-alanyl-D-alanine carboxypeptidase
MTPAVGHAATDAVAADNDDGNKAEILRRKTLHGFIPALVACTHACAHQVRVPLISRPVRPPLAGHALCDDEPWALPTLEGHPKSSQSGGSVMKTLSLVLLLPLLSVAVVRAQDAPLAKHPEVASSLRMLEAWIESQMAYRGLPGMSVGIVYDQDLIWSKGFGYSDVDHKTPATPQTIYRMASVTKLFTATAIMQLRDAGKLHLDDPIADSLPWFKIRPRVPDAPPITVRQLLTHTSGLPRDAAFPYWMENNFPTREQMIESLPKQEAVFAPETKWKYSNLALSLAGEMVSAVSGEPYEVYIQKHLLEPLGMRSTSIIFPEEHKSRLAIGYGRRMPDGNREIRPFMDCKGVTPAANLSSTVEDLARFIALQMRDGTLEDTQILKGSTLREMHRVHWLEPDWKSGQGLGFQIERDGERTLIGHGGTLAGYRTQIMISLEEKVGVIVLTNADDGNPASYVKQVFNWVAPAIKKATARPPKVAEPDPEWSYYVGKYRNPWGDSQVLILNHELVVINPTLDNPKESMLRLIPEGQHTFRITAEKKNPGAIGELAVFEFGPDGHVIRMWVGENYTYRLE